MFNLKKKPRTESEQGTEEKKHRKSWFFLGVIVAIALLRLLVFRPIWVSNVGMSETINAHDYLIVNRLEKVERFDVIAFKVADTSTKKSEYIGRVIGKAGDSLQYKDNQLLINGKKYSESYLAKNQVTEDFKLGETMLDKKIPKNCYFVLGDNRNRADDSRYFGYVKKSQVEGVIKLRLYPFNRISYFK
ncbi:MAG: signal peptidase I [Streptococcaceae bacterium]|jgi:signal peptidase I|nr:signal peptidase I [Streptococcaceae bacterium]